METPILLNKFPKDFRQKDINEIIGHVLTGKFCQLICVPGGGKATILKLLATNHPLQKFHLGSKFDQTRIIYLDLHELPNFQREQVEKFLLFAIDHQAKPHQEPLLLTKQLNQAFSALIEKNLTVVFLLDHFDEFQNRLPLSFFQLLRGFRTLNKYKFAAVFGTRRDLKDLVDPQILSKFYDFFIGNTLYLKIYDQKATEVMFSQIEQAFGQKLSVAQKQNIIDLTSGHAKLTKLVAETALREKTALDVQSLLVNPLFSQALAEIWDFLTAQEQQEVKLIAQGHKPQKNESTLNLLKFDLIDENFNFTIKLFKEFVHNIPTVTHPKIIYNPQTKDIVKGTDVISDLLSAQEYRLLRFLIENAGKIVGREEIIAAVWPDIKVQEGISDEAIDQMVFRLRKKIEDEPTSPKHLLTVKGQGIRFSA